MEVKGLHSESARLRLQSENQNPSLIFQWPCEDYVYLGREREREPLGRRGTDLISLP